MSKLTFGVGFCPTIAEWSDCHFEKWLGRLDGVDQHDKMSLWFEGFFVCSPFCFGRASSLQESSKITLCQRVTESPIMSDCL